jgi:hypothetical protein
LERSNGQDTLAAVSGHFVAAALAQSPAPPALGAGGQDSIAAPGQALDMQDAALINCTVNACTEGIFDARNAIAPVKVSVLLARLGVDQAGETVTKHLYSIYCDAWHIGRLTVGAGGIR